VGLLKKIEDFDAFKEVLNFLPDIISEELIDAIRKLDEKEEFEPFVRSILFDASSTPHGPSEIADIITHKISIRQKQGLAAFILKGKSFPVVRPKHVAHQIYRLEKITGLNFMFFMASGTILDEAKEQFCSTAERLKCEYVICDAIDLARLFVAYGFLCPRDAHRIVAGRCKCGYSPKKRILNILQVESLKMLDEAHALGQQAGLVVLPPGGGKTRIAAEDAKKFKAKKILYVAHTYEILDIAKSEFEAIFNSAKVTLHNRSSTLNNPNKVNLVTIQLLQRNLNKINPAVFDYLIVDEFHHAAASSYRMLIDKAKPSFMLGLTATPFRGDRQNILALCGENVLVNFELRTGIDNGILCPYHYFGCFDDIDYSKIKHNGLCYSIKDLEKALIVPERDMAIVSKWKECADGKPTLAFCCSHRHAERVAKSFNDNNIPANVYLSTTKAAERKIIIDKLKNGELNIVCVVDVLNEGADFPFIECLLFLRPTESKRIFYQQLGRGLRKYVGKSHCLAVDFIGNFKNAYKIVEYQGLLPMVDDETITQFTRIRSVKEMFNLPLGCEVHFDDRVIDVFAQQTLDPRHATRHNIGRILIYQYQKLARRLKHTPTKNEVDRNLLIDSSFYKLVFGSWKSFESLISSFLEKIGITKN